jgi:hypothetical protein
MPAGRDVANDEIIDNVTSGTLRRLRAKATVVGSERANVRFERRARDLQLRFMQIGHAIGCL